MSSTTHTIDPNFKKGGTIGPIEQLDLTTSNPQTVAIVDGGGAQITSFGGGTQYTEGDTDATITGTAAMMEVAANTVQPLQGTVADGLLVNLGSNNDVTVTGTVDLGATDNAVLDAIAASVAAIDTDATTIIGHVDGIEALLGTIDADTGNISTKIDTIAGAVAGTEMQVDVVASLPAGTNNIGDVDIVSGTITTVSTLTGGGVAHDAADSGNPHKVGGIAYSPDGTTPGTAVAELDRSNLKTDLNGRLFVNPVSPQRGHTHLDGSTAYTDQALVASPGAGFQTIITSIIVSTGAATAMNFFLEEGSTKIFGPIYLEATAGRGFVSGPINLPVTAATAVTITTSASIAQSVDVDYYIQAI